MKIINIKNRKEALEALLRFKKREKKGIEIKLINIHLCKINELINGKIFFKNDLYVSGETLYDIMQPVGGRGKHNHHGLKEETILAVLNSASHPIGLYEINNRYIIATVVVNDTNENIVLVVEKNASLRNNRDANINKLITIYPRRNIINVICQKNGKVIK